jgi:lysozyme family protein
MTTAPDFEVSFNRLMGNEGGYVNDPADPGGETNWGITWPVLHEAARLGIVPDGTTIRGLSRDQAKAIYRAFFWERARMEELDGAIAFQVFDAAVNHGIETAIRMLQRAARVADDGNIGPVTLAAIRGMSRTDGLILFIAERLDYWTRLKAWPDFGKGWARRAVADLRFAAADS